MRRQPTWRSWWCRPGWVQTAVRWPIRPTADRDLDDVDLDDVDLDDADLDDADRDGVDGPRAHRPRPTAVVASRPSQISVARPAKQARSPGWAERLAWFDEPPAPRPTVAAAVIEYHLTAQAPCDRSGRPRALPAQVEVLTHRRHVRRDGTLGGREPLVLHDGRPAGVLEPMDLRGLAAMSAASPIEVTIGGGTWVGSAWVQRRQGRGAQVHANIVDRVLPALCATGRAGWIEADPDAPSSAPAPLRPLRWDGDEAYRLTVEVRAVDAGAQLEAWLVRGEERLPLAALTVLFGAGCAAAGDRLIRVDHGVDLARWWATAGAGAVDVPKRQLGRFLAQLAGAVRVPALDLDPSTGWRVADVAPVPHLEQLEDVGGWFGGDVAFRYGEIRRGAEDGGGFVVDAVAQVLYRVDAAREDKLRADARARCGVPLIRRAPAADVEVAAEQMLELLPALEAEGVAGVAAPIAGAQRRSYDRQDLQRDRLVRSRPRRRDRRRSRRRDRADRGLAFRTAVGPALRRQPWRPAVRVARTSPGPRPAGRASRAPRSGCRGRGA